MSASFLLSEMLEASEPAMPTLPPLAPEMASAPITPVLSPLISVRLASMVSHLALMVAFVSDVCLILRADQVDGYGGAYVGGSSAGGGAVGFGGAVAVVAGA